MTISLSEGNFMNEVQKILAKLQRPRCSIAIRNAKICIRFPPCQGKRPMNNAPVGQRSGKEDQ